MLLEASALLQRGLHPQGALLQTWTMISEPECHRLLGNISSSDSELPPNGFLVIRKLTVSLEVRFTT